MVHGPQPPGYSYDGHIDKFTDDFFQFRNRSCTTLGQKYEGYTYLPGHHSTDRLHGSDAMDEYNWPRNYSCYAHFASRSKPNRQKISLDQAQKPTRSLPCKLRKSTVWGGFHWPSYYVAKVLWDMPHFSPRQVSTLQYLQQLCARVRSSLCLAWHLHWKAELPGFYSILSSS